MMMIHERFNNDHCYMNNFSVCVTVKSCSLLFSFDLLLSFDCFPYVCRCAVNNHREISGWMVEGCSYQTNRRGLQKMVISG